MNLLTSVVVGVLVFVLLPVLTAPFGLAGSVELAVFAVLAVCAGVLTHRRGRRRDAT